MADLMPLTRLGCVVFVAGLASWWVWVEGSHDFVLRAALIALALVMLACLATTVIGTLLTIKSVEAGHIVKSQCETGQRLQTNVRLPRMRFWPLIQVDLAWSNPSFMQATLTHDGPSWLESARATGRGRSSVIDRRVTVKDIFGFTAITLKHHQAAVLSVYPNRTPVQLQPALRDSDGDGSSHPMGAPVGDYVEMRRYGPGDPHRLILWRAFARSRRLLVRTPERAVVPLPNAAAYFVSGDADDASAALARTVLEQGLLGEDLVFGATGTPKPIRDRQHAIDAIVDSASHRDRAGQNLPAFLAQLDDSRRRQCVLFLPSEPGGWLQSVLTEIQALRAPPLILMAVDAPMMKRRRKALRLFKTEEDDRRLSHLSSYIAQFEGLGCRVQVIHQREGRVLLKNEIAAMGDS